jgi:hypothetical protein
MISTIDSFYMYVASQMAKINASQVMGGCLDAQDWPQTPPIEGAFYLLYMNAVPVGGTQAQQEYEYICQWTWLLIGADVAANQQSANRGDRYRTNLAMMENLRQAHFPGYCPKQDYVASASGAITATPKAPVETLYWSKPTFRKQHDANQSGVLYGVATVRVGAWEAIPDALL